MNIDKLIMTSVTLAIAAALTGQLPKVIREVHIAQMKLVKESQAENFRIANNWQSSSGVKRQGAPDLSSSCKIS